MSDTSSRAQRRICPTFDQGDNHPPHPERSEGPTPAGSETSPLLDPAIPHWLIPRGAISSLGTIPWSAVLGRWPNERWNSPRSKPACWRGTSGWILGLGLGDARIPGGQDRAWFRCKALRNGLQGYRRRIGSGACAEHWPSLINALKTDRGRSLATLGMRWVVQC